MWKQCIELYELLDSAYVSGASVLSLLAGRGVENAECEPVAEPGNSTDFIRLLIPGKTGRSAGGTSPTLGRLCTPWTRYSLLTPPRATSLSCWGRSSAPSATNGSSG